MYLDGAHNEDSLRVAAQWYAGLTNKWYDASRVLVVFPDMIQ